LSEAETVQASVEGVRIVEDRTYFLRDGIWVDSEYADEETIDIVAYSNAYFDLASLLEWIGPHLAIGEHAIIRSGDAFIQIGEEGVTELTEDLAGLLSS
jgi:hypothetical protein